MNTSDLVITLNDMSYAPGKLIYRKFDPDRRDPRSSLEPASVS